MVLLPAAVYLPSSAAGGIDLFLSQKGFDLQQWLNDLQLTDIQWPDLSGLHF